MATISYIDNDMIVNGTSTAYVAGVLQESGLRAEIVGGIIGNWIIGTVGNAKPAPFDFDTDVQAADTDAIITYQRAFEHEDWIDGEDRVQASLTDEETGFNARFHAIEAEFDAIREQFLRLQGVIVDLRADLHGVVRELEAKLTALQQEVHELRSESQEASPGLSILGTVQVADKTAYVMKTGDHVQLLEYGAASLGSGTIKGSEWQLRATRYDAQEVDPERVIEIVESLEDLVVVPAVGTLLERGDATVGELLAEAGTMVLSSGVSLASVLSTMPAETRLVGRTETVTAITGHLVGGLAEDKRAVVLELAVEDDAVRGGSANRLMAASGEAVGLSTAVAGALAGAGIDATVGGLAKTTTAEIAGRLAGSGASIDTGQIARAVAKGRLAGAIAKLR